MKPCISFQQKMLQQTAAIPCILHCKRNLKIAICDIGKAQPCPSSLIFDTLFVLLKNFVFLFLSFHVKLSLHFHLSYKSRPSLLTEDIPDTVCKAFVRKGFHLYMYNYKFLWTLINGICSEPYPGHDSCLHFDKKRSHYG